VPEALIAPESLRTLAVRAAARLRLDIFGGDVVLAAPGRPVLIDLNDWPSFAPVRDSAAQAIAGYVHAARPRGVLR
jgi:glutathione synthase/RimK-type ligase-like ATP-grasp enzyme